MPASALSLKVFKENVYACEEGTAIYAFIILKWSLKWEDWLFKKKRNYSSAAPGFTVHSSLRRSKAGIVSKMVGYFLFFLNPAFWGLHLICCHWCPTILENFISLLESEFSSYLLVYWFSLPFQWNVSTRNLRCIGFSVVLLLPLTWPSAYQILNNQR